MYECDGCGLQGTLAVVEDHILRNGTQPDGSFKPADQIVCWGAMFVGGPAWHAFYTHGIHPMTKIVAALKAKLAELN